MMSKVVGYAAQSADKSLERFEFQIRDLRADDVLLEVLFSGVCHTDIHYIRNEWGVIDYPLVAGHEVLGRVIAVGDDVTKFQEGDIVLRSAFIDSCGECENCKRSLEQYCKKGMVFLNTVDPKTGLKNHGGFAKQTVIKESFAVKVPGHFKPADYPALASLPCAGLTSYSPMKHWKIGKGSKVGVAGIGGLGHMGVKIAHAMGAEVVAITTSPEKEADAKRFGATEIIVSTDAQSMKKHEGTFDFILDTIPVVHDFMPYLNLLNTDGVVNYVGRYKNDILNVPLEIIIHRRLVVTGSVSGSPKDLEELVQFCMKHNILTDVELISMQEASGCFDKIINKQARYRYVIDMSSLD